jgi:hypothetical protein
VSETLEARDRSAPSLRRLAAWLDSDGALYLALLLLVWGLTVSMRGLWQDDTLLLRLARTFQWHGFVAAFTPVTTPMRRLYSLPFRLALATPQPVWTLHLIFGLTWLGQALAAGWLVRMLLPGRQLTRFLAISLTLTATSDYLTNNLTALGYNLASLMLLLAVGCCLRYLVAGRVGWIALACAATAVSIWTLDIAIPALPFLPLLLLWRTGTQAWRRMFLVLLALGLTLAPAVPIEWRLLHDPHGYAAVAMQPMRLAERLHRTASLGYENFAPWRWAFAHPVWYPRPPAAIPLWAMGLGAAGAAAWFAFRARQAQNPDPPERAARTLLLAGIFAAMALFANAAYAGLQMEEFHYRTHILSRVWASLGVAVSAGWAVRRWPRFGSGFLIAPVLLVGFGVWGGLERQDLWVSTWRLHQKELLSIVTNAPALTPGTGIILRSRPTPNLYLATEADYLAESWLVLLYDDPAIHGLRAAPDRGTGCRATPEGLDCWHEQQAECFAAGSCAADHFDYDKLVILDFDDQTGTFRLVSSARGDPLLGGSGAASASYRPTDRILKRPLTPRQRALLLEVDRGDRAHGPGVSGRRLLLPPAAQRAPARRALPEEMTYPQLIGCPATYFHTRRRTICLPGGLLVLAARALGLLPLDKPALYAEQVARLFRPKSHDTESAFLAFGFTAPPLKHGVDALFGPQSEDPA